MRPAGSSQDSTLPADAAGETLTPDDLDAQLVAELERKIAAGENLTGEEPRLWVAAVEAAKGQLPPLEEVTWNEGEPEPPEPESHRVWAQFYETPLAAFFTRRTQPRQSVATRRQRSSGRPREHRRASARARAPDDDPSDPSDEPPPRTCRGCGGSLDGYRGNRRWCDVCQGERNRANVGAFRKRLRTGRDVDLLAQYADEVARARRLGALSEDEAAELLVFPSARVLALLAERVAA